jgi:AbrB family looped-hinge helix DNA binding protein
MFRATVDDKGRIVIPRVLREHLHLGSGVKGRLSAEGGRIVISAVVDPEEFIREMRGFIKEGSPVPMSDPIELKRIWHTG